MRKILFVALLLIPLISFGQNDQQIKGIIIDEQTGVPILGANIIEKGTTNGTTTDIDGEFMITVPLSATLEVSYVGYATQEIKVGQLELDQISNLTVNLEPETSGLDEVVVVGYGQQSQVSMVGSVSTMKPEKLRTASTNITSNLIGNMAGIIGVQRSGEPGADGANFYIRGISTYSGATNPLILLDGVQISAGDLDALTPENIESVSVLKDATATAVYGNQGANGVLIVTTKTGRNLDKPQINARAQVQLSMPTTKQHFVDGPEYMKLYNEAVFNRSTGDTPYTNDQISGTIENRDRYVYPNVDWYNLMFKDATINEQANVNIRGGGKKVGYYMSASFKQESGLLKNFDLNSFSNNIDIKQFEFQNNIDAELSPTTKVALKLNTQLKYYNGPATETKDLYREVMESNPVDFPAYFPVSDTLSQVGGTRNILYGNKGGGRYNGGYINPFADMTSGYSDNFHSMILASLSGEQKLDFITKGLSFKALISFKNWDASNVKRTRGYNRYEIESYSQNPNGNYDYQLNQIGDYQNQALSMSSEHLGDRWLYIQPSLNYNQSFGNHNVGGLLVYNIKEYNVNAPDNFVASLPKRRLGLVGRFTYDYDNRYLFEANGAYNGSENFAKNHRFGFFPSMSAGYVPSNEKFYKDFNIDEVIDYLKFRVSWGRVGNDEIGGARFPYVEQINLSGLGYTTGVDQNYDQSGPSYDRLGNTDITWELADKWNIGIDMNLFNSLRFSADYFYEDRKNIFSNISGTIPNYFGTGASNVFGNVIDIRQTVVYANTGQVKNEGVDFSLDYNKQFSKDFQISAKGTFTYAHNTIKKNAEPAFRQYPNRSNIGRPIGTIFGYHAERLFIDDAEVANSPKQQIGGETVSAGDIKYTDITGDGQINSNDQMPLGHPTTPEIVYGLSTSIYYKNLDLSLLLQGSARTSLMMSGFHPFGTQDLRNVLSWVAEDRYDPLNPDIYAKYPKLSKIDNANNTVSSSYWLRDASFIKLRSAEIGYTLNNFRFFASGFNLLTLAKFNKWDPEEGGGSGLKYPTQRIINFGVQLQIN